MRTKQLILIAAAVIAASACNTKQGVPDPVRESDANYVGQAVGNFSAEEWYPGGELGTTVNITEGCYEDETPPLIMWMLTRMET